MEAHVTNMLCIFRMKTEAKLKINKNVGVANQTIPHDSRYWNHHTHNIGTTIKKKRDLDVKPMKPVTLCKMIMFTMKVYTLCIQLSYSQRVAATNWH